MCAPFTTNFLVRQLLEIKVVLLSSYFLYYHVYAIYLMKNHLDTLNLNLINFTTITKQLKQLILPMLVRTDVCVRMVFVWEETRVPGVPRGNPPVWLVDTLMVIRFMNSFCSIYLNIRIMVWYLFVGNLIVDMAVCMTI